MMSEPIFYRNEFRVRPVTKRDKWCRFTEYKLPFADAKYGYVVKVSNFYDGMVLYLDAYVIRTKVIKGDLYLQLSPFPCKWGIKKVYRIKTHEETVFKKDEWPYPVTVINLTDANKHH